MSCHVFHVSFSPYRIVDDCGAAFAMGATMGSLFHFWKGYRNSPAVSDTCIVILYVHLIQHYTICYQPSIIIHSCCTDFVELAHLSVISHR